MKKEVLKSTVVVPPSLDMQGEIPNDLTKNDNRNRYQVKPDMSHYNYIQLVTPPYIRQVPVIHYSKKYRWSLTIESTMTAG